MTVIMEMQSEKQGPIVAKRINPDPPPKILAVDDRPENLLAMEMVLRPLEAEMIEAHSGNEALSLMMRHDFAVVLLDVQMPEMDGFEMAGLMRNNKKTRDVPIIFVTANSKSMEHACNGYRVGAVDYLYKPLDSDILRAKVGVFLRLHRQKHDLASLNEDLRTEIGRREETEREMEHHIQRQAKTNKELIEKNVELDEFAYVTSHDLQEPVRKLISFSQLLREDVGEDLPKDAEEDMASIIDAATRMKELIQALLRLSRTSRATMSMERVSLDACVDEAIDVLADRIEDCHARIVRDELPDVVGDKTLLTQLYQNLLSNALKFVDEQPKIQFTASRDGENWVLGVRDNGIGMKPEFAEEIFRPFKRLQKRQEYPGTGIGLAICKKVVKRHEGRIWVESEPGKGTQFNFTIEGINVEEGTSCQLQAQEG